MSNNKIQQLASEFEDEHGYCKTVINEKEFKIKLMNTTNGWVTAQSIVSLILPSAASGLDGYRQDLLMSDNQPFTMAASLLVNRMSEVSVIGIIYELLEGALVNDKPIEFEKYFRGNYGELVALIEFAIRRNFSSFFTQTDLMTKLTDLFVGLMSQTTDNMEKEQEKSSNNESG